VIQFGSLWVTATLPRHAKSTSEGHSLEAQLPIPRLRASAQAWAGAVGLASVPLLLLLPTVFGEEFRDSAVPLMLLLCGATLFAPYIATVSAMIGSGRTRLLAWTTLGAAALNLILDIALVPRIGIVGAGIATLVQGTFNSVLIVWLARGPSALRSVGIRVLPVAIMTGATAIDPYSPLLLVALGAVSATALLSAARELHASMTASSGERGDEGPEPLIDVAGGGV
jgi:O-antigen/teichoic acid export membrane protein